MLTIQTLGTFQIENDSQEVFNLRSRKNEALLAYLLMEGQRELRRSMLAGLLWPESAEKTANLNFRQALHRIKKILPNELFTITRQTVQCHAACAPIVVDSLTLINCVEETRAHNHETRHSCVTCMEKLAAVANLYQGDFLAGLFFEEAVELEEWILFQREWLRRQALTVLDDLTRFYSERRDFDSAEKTARQQLEIDPLREVAHQQLITILADNGNRTAALQQFEQCRDLLEAELGVEPAAETQALYEQIKQRDLKPTPQTLPTARTGFFGRSAEIAQLNQLLAQPSTRLVTIVGVGGVGKTRLALQLAAQTTFLDGICFVPLDGIETDAATLAERLATVTAEKLEIGLQGGVSAEKQLFTHLSQHTMLLIFDNLEHLPLNALHDTLLALLDHAPNVKILTTSRERLNAHNEQLFQLDGLPVPEETATDAQGYATLQLLCERARRINTNFQLTDENLPAAIDICEQVAGLPLAIELAAAWVEHFTLAEIAAEIRASHTILSTRSRSLPARHTSVANVFNYSWQLLTPSLQQLLAQLAIFRGSFSRRAAITVTGGRLFELAALVDKSLLRVEAAGEYALHPLVRQFSAEKLTNPLTTETQFTTFYLSTIAEHHDTLNSTTPQPALDAIRDALPNIQHAWLLAVKHDDLAQLSESLPAIARYCRLTSSFQIGRQLLQAALESGEISADFRLHAQLTCYQAEMLNGQGLFSEAIGAAHRAIATNPDDNLTAIAYLQWGIALYNQGHVTHAHPQLERALSLTTHDAQKPDVLRALGSILFRLGDYAAARQHLFDALQIDRAHGERHGEGQDLCQLGIVTRQLGHYDEAQRYLETSLPIARELGDRLVEHKVLANLGDIAYYLQRFGQAYDFFCNSLQVAQAVGNQREIGVAFVNLAAVMFECGNYEMSKTYLQKGQNHQQAAGFERGVSWGNLCLGMIEHRMGDHREAVKRIQAQIVVMDEVGDHIGQTYARLYLGHALMALSQEREAVMAYQEAAQRQSELNLPHLALQILAGHAMSLQATGDHEHARKLTEQLYEKLTAQQVQKGYRPPALYWYCSQLLTAQGDHRGVEMALLATQLLAEQAQQITDRTLQHSYQHAVPVHHAIMQHDLAELC